jgi:hypothetical protein
MDRLLSLYLSGFDGGRIWLPRPAASQFWEIAWQCRDGDFVPPDTPILNARAPGGQAGEQRFTFRFPLAGRVSIFPGCGQRIPGKTVIGTVLYGSDLEAELAGAVRQAELELSQASQKRNHAADRCAELRPEYERLAGEVASLRQRIDRLRQENDRREQSLRLVARTRHQDAAPSPELVVPLLATRLRELFRDGSSRLLPAAGDDLGLLDRLLRALTRLRPAGQAGRPMSAHISSRFAALLTKLYAFHQASFPPAPPGLPVEVPPAFQWPELCKRHLEQLGVAVPPDFDLAPDSDDSPTPRPIPAEETPR